MSRIIECYEEGGQTIYPSAENIAYFNEKLGRHERSNFPSVKVLSFGEPWIIELANRSDFADQFHIILENGEHISGHINEQLYLPEHLPLGYHLLKVVESGVERCCDLIICPESAYQIDDLKQGKHLWGAMVQLYAVKSERNWGVGDCGDLALLLNNLSALGGAFVGLNPIHALFSANAHSASPYSPSSRMWLNPIYIDVPAVAEFQKSSMAQRWFALSQTRHEIKRLQSLDYIDYQGVMALKLKGLQLAFHELELSGEFADFVAQGGENLTAFATFHALHHHLMEQNNEQWDWRFWSSEYQSFSNQEVEKFANMHQSEILFHKWLQFLLTQQLAECGTIAKNLNMPIGLYRDLAVGVSAGGFESWYDDKLFVKGVSLGAPPDGLAPQGQNWGLAPMHPDVLIERSFKPYIELLRANMKDCGALRIDHILGFYRMWWIVEGEAAKEGAYIRYPFDELIAILALESVRHRCTIIAEALGIVPAGLLEKLERKKMLAFNMFYFEYEHGECKDLARYSYHALSAISTHDSPTIRGYFQGEDFRLGEKLGLYPHAEIVEKLKSDRKENIAAINRALKRDKVTNISLEAGQMLDNEQTPKALTHDLLHYVAKTNSALYGILLEDVLNMLSPINIPGTSVQYPNWRRKLAVSLEDFFADEASRLLLARINGRRSSF